MAFDTPLVVLASLIVFILALLFPQLAFFRSILWAPLWISFVIVIFAGALRLATVRLDRAPLHGPSSSTRQRHALRPLTFTSPSAWSAVLTRQSWETSPSSTLNPSIHRSTTPKLNARLDSIFSLVKKTLVLPWYSRTSPSPAFPDAVEVLVRRIMADLTTRAENVDWSVLIVSRILPLVKDHLHHYRSVEHLTSSSSAPSSNPALPLPLPAKPHSALSHQAHVSAGTTSPSVEEHLREWLKRILEGAMPEADRSEVVKTLAREVVLGSAMLPTFEMMCDSDFWNRQIDEKGGRYLHEQKQVNRFLSALSTLPQNSASQVITPKKKTSITVRSVPPASSISAASSTRQFESFIRSVPKLKTLGEARRLRADVEREQRSAKVALDLETQRAGEGIDAGTSAKRARTYVKRLSRAKVKIDARIAVLSRQQGQTSLSLKSSESSAVLGRPGNKSINLYTVLADPSCLAYWLEYMDRRGRSRLVQFWLTIEGFKDPLEAAGQDSALDATVLPMDTDLSINADQTIGGDVASLYEAYFARSEAPIEVPPKHVATIKEFVETGTGLTGAEDARRIKHAVFSSQKAVYEQMEEDDWPDFWKSELFLKTITDLSRSAPVTPAPQSLGASPALLSPPSHRLRQLTAPHGPLRQSSDFRSPTFRPLPSTRNGSFAPATAVPFASISTTPPVSERTLTEPKLGSRKTCAGDVDMSASTDSLPTTPPQMPRRSSHLDFLVSGDAPAESKERGALFDDTDEPVVEEEDDDFVQIQRMEAIQAALNDIIASDAASSRSREVPLSPEAESTRSPSASMVLVPPRQKGEEHTTKLLSRSVGDLRGGKTNGRSSFSAPQSQTPSAKASGPGPSLLHRARLSQLSLSEERPGKLFDDETIAEDEVGSDRDDFTIGDVVQLAAPGNLGLAVEIASCQDKITDLVKQEHLLDTLIRQAELTGNQTELRILRRSQTTVRRDLQTAIFQKAQFEQQEEENRLVPGRTSVSIPSSVINADENDGGKHVVRYTVEVQQFGEDGKAVLGWVVARRYNEFWELDRDIRERASADLRSHLLEDLRKVAELPPKKLVPNLSSSFIESRRIGLQRYLQSLTASAVLCDTPVLRSFLSRSPVPLGNTRIDSMSASTASVNSLAPHNIVKSLYKTMATSLDDALLTPSMLDFMYSNLSRQLNDVAEGLGAADLAGLGSSFLSQALNKGNAWVPGPTAPTVEQPSAVQPLGGESGMGSFTTPICDLFIELFDLKENNWLRRQAIVVILQQFLGGTIERKVRNALRSTMSADSMERTLAGLQESLWPGGGTRPPSVPRTDTEKTETRIRASKKLGLLIPDVMANMIGRGNASRAARRVFGALQDRRLNEQLILCIIDEVSGAMFPPIK